MCHGLYFFPICIEHFDGKSDDKIKTLEVVEELRSKRADMQATLLLDAFNKDRATLPLPAPVPQITPIPPPAPPDARTQEMINEKLKKAEELGEQGMVDEAQKALEEAEALKMDKDGFIYGTLIQRVRRKGVLLQDQMTISTFLVKEKWHFRLAWVIEYQVLVSGYLCTQCKSHWAPDCGASPG